MLTQYRHRLVKMCVGASVSGLYLRTTNATRQSWPCSLGQNSTQTERCPCGSLEEFLLLRVGHQASKRSQGQPVQQNLSNADDENSTDYYATRNERYCDRDDRQHTFSFKTPMLIAVSPAPSWKVLTWNSYFRQSLVKVSCDRSRSVVLKPRESRRAELVSNSMLAAFLATSP